MMMQETAAVLDSMVARYAPLLAALNGESASQRPAPGKWSAMEELGHCIDSAHNNLRRFIVSRYENSPHIVYAQDEWVRLSNYNAWRLHDIIELWRLLNLQIVSVLKQTS